MPDAFEFRLDRPHLRLFLANDGGFLAFPLCERESFFAAWRGRESYWSAVDLWGERLTVKLAVVVTACERTASVLELLATEDAERKRRDLVGEGSP